MLVRLAMPIYIWKGRDLEGKPLSGKIHAENRNIAKTILKRQSIRLTLLKKKTQWLSYSINKPVKARDVSAIFTQLATLLESGVSLLFSINVVTQSQSSPMISTLLNQLHTDLSSGLSLSQALKKQPHFFEPLMYQLVHVGEQTGKLDFAIRQIANYREKKEALQNQVKKAMYYPITILFMSVFITVILLIFVIPQFAQLFTSFGTELPLLTQGVLALSSSIQQHGLSILFVTVFVVLFSSKLVSRSEKYVSTWDKIKLHLPLVGLLIRMNIYARISQTLATTLISGLPLNQCLHLAAHTISNTHYRAAMVFIQSEVESGVSLHVAMTSLDVFPHLLVKMVAVGEESGQLDQIFAKLAKIYESQLDEQISGLTSLIEPIIMIILGIIIGTLVLAMYLPIFQIANVV